MRAGWRWFEVRSLVLIVVVLIAYGMASPLVWKHYEVGNAPIGSADLAALITVVVTILSVGLAVFGYLVFKLVDRVNEVQFAKRAEVQRWSTDASSRLGGATTLYAISVQNTHEYEALWEKSAVGEGARVEEAPEFQRWLSGAITYCRRAIAELDTIGEAPVDDANGRSEEIAKIQERIGSAFEYCNAALAYNLATRRSGPEDRAKAIELISQLDHAADADHEETYAWVLLRYSEPAQSEWKVGTAALSHALSLAIGRPEWRAGVKKRYEVAFTSAANDPDLRNALTAAT